MEEKKEVIFVHQFLYSEKNIFVKKVRFRL